MRIFRSTLIPLFTAGGAENAEKRNLNFQNQERREFLSFRCARYLPRYHFASLEDILCVKVFPKPNLRLFSAFSACSAVNPYFRKTRLSPMRMVSFFPSKYSRSGMA